MEEFEADLRALAHKHRAVWDQQVRALTADNARLRDALALAQQPHRCACGRVHTPAAASAASAAGSGGGGSKDLFLSPPLAAGRHHAAMTGAGSATTVVLSPAGTSAATELLNASAVLSSGSAGSGSAGSGNNKSVIASQSDILNALFPTTTMASKAATAAARHRSPVKPVKRELVAPAAAAAAVDDGDATQPAIALAGPATRTRKRARTADADALAPASAAAPAPAAAKGRAAKRGRTTRGGGRGAAASPVSSPAQVPARPSAFPPSEADLLLQELAGTQHPAHAAAAAAVGAGGQHKAGVSAGAGAGAGAGADAEPTQRLGLKFGTGVGAGKFVGHTMAPTASLSWGAHEQQQLRGAAKQPAAMRDDVDVDVDDDGGDDGEVQEVSARITSDTSMAGAVNSSSGAGLVTPRRGASSAAAADDIQLGQDPALLTTRHGHGPVVLGLQRQPSASPSGAVVVPSASPSPASGASSSTNTSVLQPHQQAAPADASASGVLHTPIRGESKYPAASVVHTQFVDASQSFGGLVLPPGPAASSSAGQQQPPAIGSLRVVSAAGERQARTTASELKHSAAQAMSRSEFERARSLLSQAVTVLLSATDAVVDVDALADVYDAVVVGGGEAVHALLPPLQAIAQHLTTRVRSSSTISTPTAASATSAASAASAASAVPVTGAAKVYDELGQLLNDRATASGKTGHYPDAVRDARACCVLRPDWPRGFSSLGAVYAKLSRWDDAIATYALCLRKCTSASERLKIQPRLDTMRKRAAAAAHSAAAAAATAAATAAGAVKSQTLVADGTLLALPATNSASASASGTASSGGGGGTSGSSGTATSSHSPAIAATATPALGGAASGHHLLPPSAVAAASGTYSMSATTTLSASAAPGSPRRPAAAGAAAAGGVPAPRNGSAGRTGGATTSSAAGVLGSPSRRGTPLLVSDGSAVPAPASASASADSGSAAATGTSAAVDDDLLLFPCITADGVRDLVGEDMYVEACAAFDDMQARQIKKEYSAAAGGRQGVLRGRCTNFGKSRKGRGGVAAAAAKKKGIGAAASAADEPEQQYDTVIRFNADARVVSYNCTCDHFTGSNAGTTGTTVGAAGAAGAAGAYRRPCKHVGAVLLVLKKKQEEEAPARNAQRKPLHVHKPKTDLEKARESQLRPTVSAHTADRLRHLLERNGQKTSGLKAELVSRVVDGMLFGAVPPCPVCKRGKLYYAAGEYHCAGGFDEHTKSRYACGFRAAWDRVQRAPWQHDG